MVRMWKIISVLLIGTNLLLAEGHVLELKHLGIRQLKYGGFVLNNDREIHIRAIGAGSDRAMPRIRSYQDDPENMFAYAWIINTATRKMVWRMTIDNTKKYKRSAWNRIFDEMVSLKAGEYEVYFAAVEPSFFSLNGGFISLGKLIEKIFTGKDKWDEAADDWQVRVEDVDEVRSERGIREALKRLKEKAIIQITNLHDNDRARRGFTLIKPAKVEIYAIGEGYRGEMYDYGWIINADTREKVWVMREEDSEDAGGAVKNRLFRERLTLQPGNYLVYYRLDDSHSPDEWNANPPYDPYFWGISIFPAEKDFNYGIVKKYRETIKKPIVSITRVGDYAYREAFFEVKENAKIRVHALGEGRDGEMFDYGWITNAENGETVWKMRYEDTEHAGGASKNRLFDGVIELPPGDYVVHYQTDDSHSYEEWNSAPPDDPEEWGIALYPVAADENKVTAVAKRKVKHGNIIAKLVRVGDDEHLKKQFTLTETTKIRIYALGEGDSGEMYDYGWIESVKPHRIVWRMRYRNTEHAGGARKNRMVDTVITLEPGTYRVHYQSDDSHSFRHWNEKPPYDAVNWGITLYKIDEK